jgi:hypothetical protein
MIDNENFANKKFVDLLKDRRFLLWRLAPTEELNIFWENILQNYPSLKTEIILADNYLKNYLSKYQTLDVRMKNNLLKNIRRSLAKRTNAKHLQPSIWIKYAVAACLLLFVISTTFLYLNRPNKDKMALEQIIVGNKLSSQNIQLITGGESFDFEENVDIVVDNGFIYIEKSDITIRMGSDELNRIIVPFGKRCKVKLSDGTQVWLNAGSILDFPAKFEREGRKVCLEGEAYVEVTHWDNNPFYVQTNNFDLKVLGTKFNISVSDDFPKLVALVEGCVELTENHSSCKLYPGEVAFYGTTDVFVKEKSDITKYVSWVDNYIILENKPLTEVLKYIERYYNYSFCFSDQEKIQHITCEGKLYLSDNIDNVLTSIALLSNTVYTKENNRIHILKKE